MRSGRRRGARSGVGEGAGPARPPAAGRLAGDAWVVEAGAGAAGGVSGALRRQVAVDRLSGSIVWIACAAGGAPQTAAKAQREREGLAAAMAASIVSS